MWVSVMLVLYYVEGDYVFRNSLLIFVLYVLEYNCCYWFYMYFFLIFLRSIVIELIFSLECVFVCFFCVDVFLPIIERCFCSAVLLENLLCRQQKKIIYVYIKCKLPFNTAHPL
jgi:hypothetical protein